ncbi:hypothetical protein [Mucilaginibacter sp.]
MLSRIKTFRSKLFSDITSVPEILQTAHLPGLDGLRGVVMVILSHTFMHTAYTKWFTGSIGVWIFL